jgi:hypothetical protein
VTDDEALQQAVDAAEAEVQALEQQASAATEARRALSRETLEQLLARGEDLARVLRGLTEEEKALTEELARLEQQLKKPGFQLPPRVATPLTWFFRSAAFMIYVGSAVASYNFLRSPGLLLALVLGLPIAFVAAMVAGSLRESGAAHTVGSRAGPGEEPARVVAGDERAVAARGGPGGDRPADVGVESPRAGDDVGR